MPAPFFLPAGVTGKLARKNYCARCSRRRRGAAISRCAVVCSADLVKPQSAGMPGILAYQAVQSKVWRDLAFGGWVMGVSCRSRVAS